MNSGQNLQNLLSGLPSCHQKKVCPRIACSQKSLGNSLQKRTRCPAQSHQPRANIANNPPPPLKIRCAQKISAGGYSHDAGRP